MTKPNTNSHTSHAQSSVIDKIAGVLRWLSGAKNGALSLGGKEDTHRIVVVVLFMLVSSFVVIWRAYHVQVANKQYYLDEGERFFTGSRTISVSRGMITDRFGTPLAANAPFVDVTFSPYDYAKRYYHVKKKLLNTKNAKEKQRLQEDLAKMDLARLSKASGVSLEVLKKATALDETVDVNDAKAVEAVLPTTNSKGQAVPYRWLPLMTKATPEQANPVDELNFVGVDSIMHHHRFYLQGEAMSQIVGYMGTTKDNPTYRGRTGIEAQYEQLLAGSAGKVRVLEDSSRSSLKQLKEEIPAIEGQDIALTIDARLQYILYKELEALGRNQSAMWTSGIITDIHTGEVLAMGAWPSFNNNNLSETLGVSSRNRPVVDAFESGSVMKVFTVAAALESGKYNKHTLVDTTPGVFRVGGIPISDSKNYGKITLGTIIQKSSNVGTAKIALSLPRDAILNMQTKFGFGQKTALNFPAEHTGKLVSPEGDEGKRATMAYGYGQNVTLAQLAQAYGVFGTKGQMHPLKLVKDAPTPQAIPVVSPKTAQAVLEMMELVTMKGGTAEQANIEGYRLAGKTGTARRFDMVAKKYSRESHRNLFAGLAPASNPKFAIVILAEDPQKGNIAGKTVAPVFAKVAEETLRLYNVPYDKPLDLSKE